MYANESAPVEEMLSTFRCALNERQTCQGDSQLFKGSQVGEWMLIPDATAPTHAKWHWTVSQRTVGMHHASELLHPLA